MLYQGGGNGVPGETCHKLLTNLMLYQGGGNGVPGETCHKLLTNLMLYQVSVEGMSLTVKIYKICHYNYILIMLFSRLHC